ncbi:MAG: hypothetical protein KA369_09340 [Spirochaetes bacterium]|nr:hypothetical protein [Spirochaetota bacterium]
MYKIIFACVVSALVAAALIAYGGRDVPAAHFPGRLAETSIVNPITIEEDPYRNGTDPPGDHTMKSAVCGFRFADVSRKRYSIRTFRDEADAARSGYAVTHRGYCGTCSTLKDLAVYLERRDMTYAVRSCSFRMTRCGILSCLGSMGFTGPCALTWYYNIRNTARHCLGTCLLSWMKREPLNRADGSLNDCIRCDEDRSGPIFKYYAGRTRRNSGIKSEIGRDPKEIYRVIHDYR